MFARHQLGCPVAMLLLLCLVAAPATAATFAWDGGGNDDNVANATNWQGNIAPPSTNGTAFLNFRGNVRLTPINFTMYFVDGIGFPNDGVSSFTLSGARYFVGDGGIRCTRGGTQTINNAITLEAGVNTHQWVAGPGLLELRGDIDLQSIPVKVTSSGTSHVQLFGEVTGVNGSIDVGWSSVSPSAGKLVLSGNVNVDVDTHIGTLVIDTDQPQPPFTTLQFSNGTNFQALGTHNIEQALQLTGDVTYDGSGTLRSSQTISGSGNLIVDGSASAILGLGPVNNFSPFSGDVTVIQGQLELNGGGTIAQLAGALDVGNSASGAVHSAVVRGSNPGVIANNSSLTVHRAGVVDIAGPISFSALNLLGGDLVVDAPVTAEPIVTGGSTRTASLDAPWSVPTRTPEYFINTTDGSANPDLRLLQGCTGGGKIRVTGGGQVELNGDPAAGPGGINVNFSELMVNRTGGASILQTAHASSGTIRTQGADQLGSACVLTLGTGGTLDIGSNLEHIQKLSMSTDAQVAGSGVLFLNDDLDILGDADIQPTLSFTIPAADIDIAWNATLTTGFLDGGSVFLLGGGVAVPEEINCDFTVSDGTLRFQGFVDGNLEIYDTLEIPMDVETVGVNGDVVCGPASTLILDFDASGATSGDEFLLINCNSIDGSFPNVQYPTPPADHFWTLVYGPGQLILRLDALALAELDLDHGTNGQEGLFQEGLEGVAGLDFTIQGFDDIQLCSVTVDSIMSPLSSSTVGVRLYHTATQTLLASTERFFAQTPILESFEFPLAELLQPGDAYRLVVYGTGDLLYQSYTPDLPFPYLQSELVQINGAYRNQLEGDIFPTAPLGRFHQLRLTLGPCDLTAAPPASPGRYELALDMYPNPFNPRTTVSFELPREGRARVDAFDARGRHVAALVDEHKPAGRFSVQWLGTDDRGMSLGSGVYFLRLTHPAGERIERVTLIK